jgi:hypothetical protein
MSLPTKGAGGSASAAFAQMLYDEFTEANGFMLNAHTPDVGAANWYDVVGDLDIQTTHASAKTLPTGYAFSAYTLPRTLQTLSCNWRNVNDFADMRTCFRILNDDNYFYVNYDTNGNTIKLYRKIATVSVQLDTAAVAIANTTWYAAWIDVTGNLIEVYHAAFGAGKPGSAILSASDSNLQSQKGVGFYGGNAGQWWDKLDVWG